LNSYNRSRPKPFSPVDPHLDFLPPNSYVCKTDCHTILINEFRTKKEYVTGVEHDQRRCYQVKEMAKEEKRGPGSKVPRISVVIDLQDTHDLKPGMNPVEMVYKMLKYRKSWDLGVTLKELALALFPDLHNFDKEGNKEPTVESIRRIGQYLSKLRKWDKNYFVVSYADRTQFGLIIYWNQQTEEDIKKAERRIEAEIKGRQQNLEKAKEVVNLSEEDRKKEEKKLDKYIEEQIKTRKDKKKKGDNNGGGVY